MAKTKEKVSKKEKPKKKKITKKQKPAKKRAELKVGPVRSSQEIKSKRKSLVRSGKYATSNGVEKKPAPKAKPERYFEAVGRRKTSIARVRIFTRGDKIFLVNGKPCDVYFPTLELQQIAKVALEKMKCLDKFRIQVFLKGGGLHSQAEAARHGIARALVLFNNDFRKRLKKAGFLTRDPRMRERKKFGLKRARRAPQWQKR
jgi:small subunit ribosomal protein S9